MLDFAGPADKYFPSRKKKCPPSTTATGTGYCVNPNPDKAGYILAIKKHCPPFTTSVGAGFCKVSYAEQEGVPCPDKKPEDPQKKVEAAAPKPPTEPQATPASQSDPAATKDPSQKKPPCVKKPEVPGKG